jgi:hypothetical protein
MTSKAKEKLVERLISGNDDIFTEFVIVGLEEGLNTIVDAIVQLINRKSLSDVSREDLNELHYDGAATIRVLKYYTAGDYFEEQKIVNAAKDRLIGEVY